MNSNSDSTSNIAMRMNAKGNNHLKGLCEEASIARPEFRKRTSNVDDVAVNAMRDYIMSVLTFRIMTDVSIYILSARCSIPTGSSA